MRIITDEKLLEPRLKTHVEKFGHRPEHQSWLFLYEADPRNEVVYFDFDADGGVFTEKRGKHWYISEEPIAPSAKRVNLFLQVLKYIFTDSLKALGRKKLSMEDWSEEFKEECVNALRPLPYRVLRPNTILYSPVINLEKFDETLSGSHMKGLRYMRNRFLKIYEIEVQNAKKTSVKQMISLLKTWVKIRTGRDKVWAYDYEKFILRGFPGCDIARAIYKNGTLIGLSAGWQIPNSRNYYLYLDIHDYSDRYLGEFVSLDHILEAKKQGHKLLDFGGSDKSLLDFKMKFHPAFVYRTSNFSIVSNRSLRT